MDEEVDSEEFERLLEYLRQSRGFDFTGYKRPSLIRRVNKRMQDIDLHEYGNYVDFLEAHPDEFGRLFDTILINVTAFFRDPHAWEIISGQVIPRILASKRLDEPIRVWVAGCATGEEAYTMAMLMAEALDHARFRARVKIYATDVDEDALARARQATYSAKDVQSVPPELLEKYFDAVGNRFHFQKEIRRSVIFGRHDVIQDAPISRIDILSCRNALMYLNPETQSRILDRFHFALNEHGALMLGKAETLMTYSNIFIPVDLKQRIFVKASRANLHDRLLIASRAGLEKSAENADGHERIRESAFETNPIPQVLIDYGGTLAMANDRARALFNLGTSDLLRPLQDLQLSYRPAELRSRIDLAYSERRPVLVKDVEWPGPPAGSRFFDVNVVPLLDSAGCLLGASITFLDVTASKRIADEHVHSTRELESAYEQLQSTNEMLETTNEELQSAVEELETTYEELQSTNEELETMNEELQSTNEELETVNAELRDRSDELNRVNTLLGSVLSSLRSGVVVVDREFKVLVWNRFAENFWGLRQDEVRGKNLLNLEIDLPMERLKQILRSCFAGETPLQNVVLPAGTRRGREIRCRFACSPLTDSMGIVGAILVVEQDADGSTMPTHSDGHGSTAAVAVAPPPAASADGHPS